MSEGSASAARLLEAEGEQPSLPETSTGFEQMDLFGGDFDGGPDAWRTEPPSEQGDVPAESRQIVVAQEGDGDNAAERAGGGGEYTFRLRRPRFMEEAALTPAERGTVSHLVMQHIPLGGGDVTEDTIAAAVAGLVERRMLTKTQAEAVDVPGAAAFFREEVGSRLLAAPWVRRETPFSCTLPAALVYPGMTAGIGGEPILIQGVIDCLFEDERGLVLLDYKTDRVRMGRWAEAAERHRFQLTLYAEAIAGILGRKVDECYVFFLDGVKAVKLF